MLVPLGSQTVVCPHDTWHAGLVCRTLEWGLKRTSTSSIFQCIKKRPNVKGPKCLGQRNAIPKCEHILYCIYSFQAQTMYLKVITYFYIQIWNRKLPAQKYHLIGLKSCTVKIIPDAPRWKQVLFVFSSPQKYALLGTPYKKMNAHCSAETGAPVFLYI